MLDRVKCLFGDHTYLEKDSYVAGAWKDKMWILWPCRYCGRPKTLWIDTQKVRDAIDGIRDNKEELKY